jgi:hypothetical protein
MSVVEHKGKLTGIHLAELMNMFTFFVATRHFLSAAVRFAGLTGSRQASSVHVHWDRISRQWVRRELG